MGNESPASLTIKKRLRKMESEVDVPVPKHQKIRLIRQDHLDNGRLSAACVTGILLSKLITKPSSKQTFVKCLTGKSWGNEGAQ